MDFNVLVPDLQERMESAVESGEKESVVDFGDKTTQCTLVFPAHERLELALPPKNGFPDDCIRPAGISGWARGGSRKL